MKVYVMCEAALFQPEKFVDVKSSQKKAEKAFRDKYPHCRKFEGANGEFSAAADNSNQPTLLFIHEKELD